MRISGRDRVFSVQLFGPHHNLVQGRSALGSWAAGLYLRMEGVCLREAQGNGERDVIGCPQAHASVRAPLDMQVVRVQRHLELLGFGYHGMNHRGVC
jgi:hypothetical protein